MTWVLISFFISLQTSHYSKLEKADILEMTVKHLRMMQRRQISSAVAADPTVATKYNVGFSECASEVIRYMSTVQGVNQEVKSRVVSHLDNCLHSMATPAPVMTQHVQPIHVQIPASQGDHHMYHSERLLVPTTPPRQQSSLPSHPSHMNNMNMSGSFELIPGNGFNGPVALYLGPSTEVQNRVPMSQKQIQMSMGNLHRDSRSSIDNINMVSCSPSELHSNTTSCYTGSKSSSSSGHSSGSPVLSPAMCALKEERPWRPWWICWTLLYKCYYYCYIFLDQNSRLKGTNY